MPPLSQVKYLRYWILGSVILLLFSVGYWFRYHFYPSTDDAYVQANVVYIAPQITGPVDAVYAQDHQSVSQGQLLFTIDPRPFIYARDNALAIREQSQATLLLAEQTAQRIFKLVNGGQLPLTERDNAQAKMDHAKGALNAAQASLEQAELDLLHTKIYAPNAGIVTNFLLRPGTIVTRDVSAFTLVEQTQFWIDANFKETQIKRIRPGQTVSIDIDMYPGVLFKGVVNQVSAGSGAIFSLLPPENATGNWVKVTQRFPVKIFFTDAHPRYALRMGASATVTVDTFSPVSK